MSLNRRQFIRVCAAGVTALLRNDLVAGVSEPAPRARFRLGLGTYTFRQLDIKGLIDRCRELRLTAIELSHPQYMLPRAKLDDFPSVREQLTSGGVNLT